MQQYVWKLLIRIAIFGPFLAIMAAGPGGAIFPESFLLGRMIFCPEPAQATVDTRRYAYGTTRDYTVHVYSTDVRGSWEEINPFLAFLALATIYLLQAMLITFVAFYSLF